jgi:outer membrane lipoprotein carrier protein
MNYTKKIIIIMLFIICSSSAFCADLDNIINNIEKRYKNKGFSAYFLQKSTLKAMELTDTAFGNVFFKYPNKMFWEYEKPEPQKIIFNGKRLWIYSEADNQVMTGDGSEFFKGGKGASFLTDIDKIRKNFEVSIIKENEKSYSLKLIPFNKTPDISYIKLAVLKENFNIIQAGFFNDFGDENILTFSNIQLIENIDEFKFEFTPPKGVDILEISE